jgi:hypothetical protein
MTKRRSKVRISGLIALVVLFFIGFGLVYFWANGTLSSFLSGGLIPVSYSFEGTTYNLLFYPKSVEESANEIPSLTEGGKKLLTNPAVALVSPVLGSYGSGLDMFIVPGQSSPVLPHNKCSDNPKLHTIMTIPMSGESQPAVVCSLIAPGSMQSEYLFQFTEKRATYDGFVQLTFNWDQVTSSQSATKAFEKTTGLTHYNPQIKTMISSIKVK